MTAHVVEHKSRPKGSRWLTPAVIAATIAAVGGLAVAWVKHEDAATEAEARMFLDAVQRGNGNLVATCSTLHYEVDLGLVHDTHGGIGRVCAALLSTPVSGTPASGTPASGTPASGSQPITASRYKPVDPTAPWSALLNVTVTRSDLGSAYLLQVDFTVPVTPNPVPYGFDLITVYGFQRHGTERSDLPLGMFPSTRGSWKPGDTVTLKIDIPKQYADPAQGWDLRFCVGSTAGCLPSPNLLLGSPV